MDKWTLYVNGLRDVFGITAGDWIAQHWWVVVLFVVWSFVWKVLALWRAAQLKAKAWFVFLLLVNSAGILDILYLYFFSKISYNAAEQDSDQQRP